MVVKIQKLMPKEAIYDEKLIFIGCHTYCLLCVSLTLFRHISVFCTSGLGCVFCLCFAPERALFVFRGEAFNISTTKNTEKGEKVLETS